MSEILATHNADGMPTLEYGGTLEDLANTLEQGKIVFFLGAGIAMDDTKAALPSGTELAKIMAKKSGLEWHQAIPLSTIAFYYESFHRRRGLNRLLREQIGDPKVDPSNAILQLVQIIDRLEQQHREVLVVTTNYDRQFEIAYRTQLEREPGVIIYNGGVDANAMNVDLHVGLNGVPSAEWLPKDHQTYLYKMHGCISNAGDEKKPDGGRNLVITEEDYVNFLTNSMSSDPRKRLLQHVMGRIADSTILFLGYSLQDWNFRVIFKASAERYRIDRYAVQLFDEKKATPEETGRWNAIVNFWNDKDVDIINTRADMFLEDLLKYVPGSAVAVP
jgi:hypothetical protein